MDITRALPDADAVLQLEPHELAAYLLEHLHARPNDLHRGNLLSNGISQHYRNDERVTNALMEAWAWLTREGLLVEKSGGYNWFFISRRGQRLRGRKDFASFQHSNVLPRASLHRLIGEHVWSAFARGEYDTAVFQAFREVEIAVRSAAELTQKDIGIELVGKAFHVETGPLADMSLLEPERRAMLVLFSGAMGLFKNPSSHRHITLTDPHEAAEIIGFASMLMRIVDSRRGKPPE